MTRLGETAGLAVAVFAAVAVPAVAWHFTAAGQTAAPFGWPRLLVAHLAAAVPLAYCLARRLGPWGTPAGRFFAAAAVTAAFAVALPVVGDALDAARVGFAMRAVVRTVLAVLVAAAWLSAAAAGPRTGVRLPWVAAVAFAVVPPAVYADRLAAARAGDFDTFAKSGRLVRVRAALEGLRDAGSARTFAGKTAAEWLPRLQKDIDRLALRAEAPLGPTPSTAARLGRATLLVSLNRTADADAVLQGVAEPTPAVWMMRAAVARESGRWADLEAACRTVTDDTSPEAAVFLVDAYHGRGEALRQLGRPSDAAVAYREAADRLPDRAGYFHYQLGLLAADRGRPDEALDLFRDALRLDPTLSAQVEPQLRRVRTNTVSCLSR